MFESLNWFLKYQDLDSDTLECWQVSECTFIADFGPWKEGEYAKCVSFNLLTGEMKSWLGGRVGKVCKFALAPMAQQ